MRRPTRPVIIIATIAALTLLAGACSDDDNVTPDSTVTGDTAVADQASSDQAAGQDQGQKTDTATTPDTQTKGDAKGQHDAKGDAKGQHDAAPGCGGVSCSLLNNCCDCKAYSGTPPTCSITSCKQPTCSALGIKQPAIYCLKGHCFVTDSGTTCTTDSDCKLIDDCCSCLSWPKGATPPACNITTCFVNTCTSYSMGNYKARCIGGLCKLGM